MSRIKKVPYVEQLQQTECGLCCIAMILRYYGSYETLNDIRDSLEVGRDGARLSQLNKLMQNLGFSTHVYKTTIEGLKMVSLPAIIFWSGDHYVVLESISKKDAVVIDPAFGRKKISLAELERQFDRFVLTAEPTEQFIPAPKKRSIWFDYFANILKEKRVFFKIFFLSVFTYLITLMMPILVQYLIDEVALQNRQEMFYPLLGGIFAILILMVVLVYSRGRSLLGFQAYLDKTLLGKTFKHLLQVPYKFFDVRANGDILVRLNSLHVIRDLLSDQLIRGIIDCGALLFILLYMFQKSILLTGLAVFLLLITGAIILYFKPYIAEANKYEIIEASKMQAYQVEVVYSILGIKTSGIEQDIYNKWESKLDNFLDRYKAKGRIINLHNTFMNIQQNMFPLFLLFAGITRYFAQEITLGEVFAFYTLSNMFFSLAVSLFYAWNNYVLATSYLERLRDITDYEIEKQPESPICLDVSGEICLEDVSFSYTKHSQEVLKNISLQIKQGNKIAIVGESGSGKSTLCKIILGLYTPTRGKIYYNNVDLDFIEKRHLRRQMGIVPQDVFLFNNSIMENIRMNKDNIDLEQIKEAARIAQISQEIEQMPMGYHTLVSEMGMNLSGGQRQRVALARALINNPKLIILDEATSSLDAINESRVSDYFRSVSCTRIVIAHRLSTIIDADIIYVLDQGRIVESGTHEELMQLQGTYYNLYKFQTTKEATA